jgi:hypothetical protein
MSRPKKITDHLIPPTRTDRIRELPRVYKFGRRNRILVKCGEFGHLRFQKKIGTVHKKSSLFIQKSMQISGSAISDFFTLSIFKNWSYPSSPSPRAASGQDPLPPAEKEPSPSRSTPPGQELCHLRSVGECSFGKVKHPCQDPRPCKSTTRYGSCSIADRFSTD